MQKATAMMKKSRRGSDSSNKEQKRKSALISMAVPVNPKSPNSRKSVTRAAVRTSSSSQPNTPELKPHLVRVVSLEDESAVMAEDPSFHDDLHRLGNAIRSLSIVLPPLTKSVVQGAGMVQNPFEAPAKEVPAEIESKPLSQNPFDELPAPPVQIVSPSPSPPMQVSPSPPSPPVPVSAFSPVRAVPPVQAVPTPTPPVQVRPSLERRASQNPFDQAMATEQAEKALEELFPATEIDTDFGVPLDGEKVLMAADNHIDTEFDVPLDGYKVLMAPHPAGLHFGNETTDDEDEDDEESVVLQVAETIEILTAHTESFC